MMTYNSWGALSKLTNGCAGSGCTQAVETYDYNDRLQPVRVQLGTSSNTSANYCLVYNYYQGAAQPSSCTATPSQASSGDDGTVAGYFYQDNANSGLSHTASFTYDGANELATAVATGNSTYNLTFNTDRYGNTSCVQNGSTQGLCPQYGFDTSYNQINNTGYGYDAAGDMTGDGTYDYQYDAEGHLTKMTLQSNGSVFATATYNAMGQMVTKVLPNVITYENAYDPSGMLLGVYNEGGSYWFEQNIWEAGRLLGYYYPNGNIYFIHRNNNGSSTQLTTGTGGLAGDMLFYPYGQEWQYDNGVNAPWWQFYNSFGRLAADLGFYVTPNRLYSSGLGRWLTPDPLGGDILNPQSMNRYAYVTNNPATGVDPEGLAWCKNDGTSESNCQQLPTWASEYGCALRNGEVGCYPSPANFNFGTNSNWELSGGFAPWVGIGTLMEGDPISREGQAALLGTNEHEAAGYIPVSQQGDCPGCLFNPQTDDTWDPSYVSLNLINLVTQNSVPLVPDHPVGPTEPIQPVAAHETPPYHPKPTIKGPTYTKNYWDFLGCEGGMLSFLAGTKAGGLAIGSTAIAFKYPTPLTMGTAYGVDLLLALHVREACAQTVYGPGYY